VPELHLLLHQGTDQHQGVLLVHQGVGGAVHQHQVATLDVARLHREVRLLEGPQVVALQRDVALREEGVWNRGDAH